MRINLKVPFAQKEAAKALGARWDGARKIWYVIDPESLDVFTVWMPEAEAAHALTHAALPAPKPMVSAKALHSAGVLTGPEHLHALCTCAVQPWDACPHSTA